MDRWCQRNWLHLGKSGYDEIEETTGGLGVALDNYGVITADNELTTENGRKINYNQYIPGDSSLTCTFWIS